MKKLSCFIMSLLLCITSCAMTVSAASQKPVKVSFSVISATSVKIKWTRISSAKKYIIMRSSKKSSGYKTIKILTSKSNCCTDKSISFSKQYYYKVKTVYGKNSKTSSALGVRTGKPSSFAAVGDTNLIRLKWNSLKGVGGYQIWRSESKNGKYKLIKTSKTNHYENTQLPCGKTYYYKIRTYKTVKGKKTYSLYSSVCRANTNAHSFTAFSSGRVGCQADTYKISRCTTCGYEIRTAVPAEDHIWYAAYIIPSSCTDYGCTVYMCSVCGSTYNGDYTVPPGHNYLKADVVASTCTQYGYTLYKCSKCADEYYEQSKELLQHNIVSINHSATCTDEGYTVDMCTSCGLEYSSHTNIIPPLGHRYIAHRKPDGTIIYICSNCDDEKPL